MVDEKISKTLPSTFIFLTLSMYVFHLPISSVSTSTNKILLWNRDWSGNSSYGSRINILGLTRVGYNYCESFMERNSIFICCWFGLEKKKLRSLTIITNPSTMTVAHTTCRIRFNVLTLSWQAIFCKKFISTPAVLSSPLRSHSSLEAEPQDQWCPKALHLLPLLPP